MLRQLRPPARGNVEELLLHMICGNDDSNHGLSLTPMGGNGIPVVELAIVCRNSAAIIEMDQPIRVHSLHLNQCSVCCSESCLAPVTGQQQPVGRRNLDFLKLMDAERFRLPCGQSSFFPRRFLASNRSASARNTATDSFCATPMTAR